MIWVVYEGRRFGTIHYLVNGNGGKGRSKVWFVESKRGGEKWRENKEMRLSTRLDPGPRCKVSGCLLFFFISYFPLFCLLPPFHFSSPSPLSPYPKPSETRSCLLASRPQCAVSSSVRFQCPENALAVPAWLPRRDGVGVPEALEGFR